MHTVRVSTLLSAGGQYGSFLTCCAVFTGVYSHRIHAPWLPPGENSVSREPHTRKKLLLLHMVQQLIIALLFAGALFYLGRMLYRSFRAKSTGGCASGCGKCGVTDIEKTASEIQKNGL